MAEGALVGLADAITGLRSQLADVVEQGAGQGLQFALDPIELTVQVVVTGDGTTGVSWNVVKAEGSYERARTQTLTLRLTPVWRTRDGALTTDFTVAEVGTAAGVGTAADAG